MQPHFTIVILTLLLSNSFLTAQQDAGPYKFIMEQDTYVPLTFGTDVPDLDQPWDDPEYSIPLEFDYDFFGFPCDSIFVLDHGAFFNSETSYDEDEAGAAIFPYLVDLIDLEYYTNDSPVRYQTDGSSGNRIFKFELSNAGFYDDSNQGDNASFVNIQFWLYESDGSFEYRYGPSEINDTYIFEEYGGPIVGAVDSFGYPDTDAYTWFFLVGDPASPDIELVDGDNINLENDGLNLDGTPADGTVYRFYIPDVAAKDIPALDLNLALLENPIVDQITLLVNANDLIGQTAELNISNTMGQQLFTNHTRLSAATTIDSNELPGGNYFLTVTTKSGFKTIKFIKL